MFAIGAIAVKAAAHFSPIRERAHAWRTEWATAARQEMEHKERRAVELVGLPDFVRSVLSQDAVSRAFDHRPESGVVAVT